LPLPESRPHVGIREWRYLVTRTLGNLGKKAAEAVRLFQAAARPRRSVAALVSVPLKCGFLTKAATPQFFKLSTGRLESGTWGLIWPK
jgi:hypothetical protein